jgi:hypothetical protein
MAKIISFVMHDTLNNSLATGAFFELQFGRCSSFEKWSERKDGLPPAAAGLMAALAVRHTKCIPYQLSAMTGLPV